MKFGGGQQCDGACVVKIDFDQGGKKDVELVEK